jgi:hypothetical protein
LVLWHDSSTFSSFFPFSMTTYTVFKHGLWSQTAGL